MFRLVIQATLQTLHACSLAKCLKDWNITVSMLYNLLLLQYMLEPCFGCYFLYKFFSESSQWEDGPPQGILWDLAEEKGLVFKVISTMVQPHS